MLENLTEAGSGWAAGDLREGHLVRVEAVEGFSPRRVGEFKERWFIERGGITRVYQVEFSSNERGEANTDTQLLCVEKPMPNRVAGGN